MFDRRSCEGLWKNQRWNDVWEGGVRLRAKARDPVSLEARHSNADRGRTIVYRELKTRSCSFWHMWTTFISFACHPTLGQSQSCSPQTALRTITLSIHQFHQFSNTRPQNEAF